MSFESEKEKYFVERTKKHIELVNMFYKLLKEEIPALPDDWDFSEHDADKLQEPLKTPYVEITWKYKNTDYILSDEMQKQCDLATLAHITQNEHHAEFWDKENAQINPEDRDKSSGKLIDASDMPTKYLVEMVCDWSAVAWERERKSPRDWAKKNIGIRWNFTKTQTRKIYMLISVIERILEKAVEKK